MRVVSTMILFAAFGVGCSDPEPTEAKAAASPDAAAPAFLSSAPPPPPPTSVDRPLEDDRPPPAMSPPPIRSNPHGDATGLVEFTGTAKFDGAKVDVSVEGKGTPPVDRKLEKVVVFAGEGASAPSAPPSGTRPVVESGLSPALPLTLSGSLPRAASGRADPVYWVIAELHWRTGPAVDVERRRLTGTSSTVTGTFGT